MKAIVNGRLVLSHRVVSGLSLVFDNQIQAICPAEELAQYQLEEMVDAANCYVCPGFIDIHIHGIAGADTMDASVTALSTMSQALASCGVTSFLAATMSAPINSIYAALEAVRQVRAGDLPGAQLLGAYLEGPFINHRYRGAHEQAYLTEPDSELVAPYLDVVKVVTYAPELDKELQFAANMRANEVVLTVGHSAASYELAAEVFRSGLAQSATHLFNAMSPLHHREPGVVGAVLNSKAFCELIADNVHLHPALYSIIARAKGTDLIILVSDAMRAALMKEGHYRLGDVDVVVTSEQGTAAARLADGRLAGSVLTLDRAVKNLWAATELELRDIIKMVTLNPAVLLGVDQHKGRLAVGSDADIVVLGEDLEIKRTFVRGHQVYHYVRTTTSSQ